MYFWDRKGMLEVTLAPAPELGWLLGPLTLPCCNSLSHPEPTTWVHGCSRNNLCGDWGQRKHRAGRQRGLNLLVPEGSEQTPIPCHPHDDQPPAWGHGSPKEIQLRCSRQQGCGSRRGTPAAAAWVCCPAHRCGAAASLLGCRDTLQKRLAGVCFPSFVFWEMLDHPGLGEWEGPC